MPSEHNGSNTPSNDSAADWMREYRQQKRKCEEENSNLRNIVKRAKADGMNTKAMIDAVKATKLDPDEVAAGLRDQIRYMGIIHVPMTQAALFEGNDSEVNSTTRQKDDLWDAGDAGYRAGRAGAKIEDCTYEPGTPFHVEWLREWHKGQASIARELGDGVKPASTSRARPGARQRQGALDTEVVPYVPAGKPARKSAGRKSADDGASPPAAA